MSTQLKLRRGNTAQTSAFTGALAEVTVDTDLNTLVVHNGTTVGGTYIAKLSDVNNASNISNGLAQAAFDYANTRYSSSGGLISGDVSVSGNLTVTGETFYANVAQLNVEDNIITLNSNVTGAPTMNAGISINRGSSPNVEVLWHESATRWEITNDGTNYKAIAGLDDVQSANNSLKSYVDKANTDMKLYVDAANSAMQDYVLGIDNDLLIRINGANNEILATNSYLQGVIGTANNDMLGYVNNQVSILNSTIGAANSSMKQYVDASNTSLKAYTDNLVSTANTDLKNYTDNLVSTANTDLKNYTDNLVSTANTDLKNYTDNLVSTANTNLKNYTDNLVSTANTFLQANDASTLAAAKSYTDTANTDLKAYTDNLVSTANTFLQANDASTLTAAQSYTDTANTNLKNYTDNLVSTANTNLKAYTDNLVSTANTDLKNYTDNLVSAANTFLQANDSLTLAAAKSYTDSANTLLQNEITYITGVNTTQNTGISNADTKAQNAWNTANTKLATTGGTITGSLNITNDLNVSGNVNFTGNVTNVTITGNTGQFFGYSANGFDALYAGIPTGFDYQPQTIFQMVGDYDGYAQLNIQNINTGQNASSDLVATADNGNENDTFIDIGINSSTYNNPDFSLGGVNDGYVYVHGNTSTGGGNLIVATMHENDIIFALNGQTTENEVARFKYGEGLKLFNKPIIFSDGTSQNTAAAPFAFSNAAYDQANTATNAATSAGLYANDALSLAQSAYGQANTATNAATSAGLYANTGINAATSAGLYANDALSLAQAAYGQANTATNAVASAGLYANDALSLAQAAYNQANIDFTTINTTAGTYGSEAAIPVITLTANGRVSSITNTSISIPAGTSIVANSGQITANASTGTVALGLATTGVTPATYGTSTSIPSITVDAFGRITSASNNSVSTTINLTGTTGTGNISGGGTLRFASNNNVDITVRGSNVFINTPQSLTTSATPTFNTVSLQNLNTSYSNQFSKVHYTNTGSPLAEEVDSWAINTFGSGYRSAKYFVSMTDFDGSPSPRVHVIELIVIHDDTNAYLTQYGEIYNSSSLGTFTANVVSGSVILYFTPNNPTSTVMTLHRTLMKNTL